MFLDAEQVLLLADEEKSASVKDFVVVDNRLVEKRAAAAENFITEKFGRRNLFLMLAECNNL